MQRALLLPVAALVAALSFSAPAGAYCRTTTVPVPPDYDPTVAGCITEGTPLAWPSMPVTYELNQAASKQVSFAEAAPIFEAAFQAWQDVMCPMGGHPSLSFDTLAPTDAAFVPCAPDAQACEEAEAHGPHQILFRDDAWPYNDTANAIALTTVAFGEDSGHILSANMEINSHDFSLSTLASPPAGAIALSAIARHEAGHFIGLAHSQVPTAAMFRSYSADMESLTQDDIDGVCAIYPPASGCSCSAEGREDGGPALATAAVVLALVAARQRRRSSCARRAPLPRG
jgi:MYXO-CTERM domain-containing protein